MYKYFFKRLFDIIGALFGLILLSPVFLVVGLLVRIKLGAPIIFKQKRPGKNEKIFTMYKFRTMTDEKDDNGDLLPDSVRLTKFGKFLRSTSLDELPELWNIFIGNMSFIGPRPLLVVYLDRYSDEQRKRHSVRPGLTGLAQVNGRNAVRWDEKFNLDVKYSNELSIWNDLKIFIKTFLVVLRRDGVSSETSVTMEEFMGE